MRLSQNGIFNRREPQRLLFQRVVFAALCVFLCVLCVLKTFETASFYYILIMKNIPLKSADKSLLKMGFMI
jgi:hypothetical protein